MESSPDNDEEHPHHHEAQKYLWKNTETEARTTHSVFSAALDQEAQFAYPGKFNQQKLLEFQKEEELCLERAQSVHDSQSCWAATSIRD